MLVNINDSLIYYRQVHSSVHQVLLHKLSSHANENADQNHAVDKHDYHTCQCW